MAFTMTYSRVHFSEFCSLLSEVMENVPEDLEGKLWRRYQFNEKTRLGQNPNFGTVCMPSSNVLALVKTPLPYMPSLVRYEGCEAIKENFGLFTPCGAKVKDSSVCARCMKGGVKFGTIADRGEVGSFITKEGKKEITYGQYLKKKKIDYDDVKREMRSLGISLNVPEEMLEIPVEEAKPKNRRGNKAAAPAALALDSSSDEEEEIEASQMSEADSEAVANAKVALEAKRAKAIKEAAEKEEAKAAEKAEKEAAKAAEKAEKEAAKAAAKAAADEAKAAAKAAADEAKAAAKAEVDAAKAAAKAAADEAKAVAKAAADEAKAVAKAAADQAKEAAAKAKAAKLAEKAKSSPPVSPRPKAEEPKPVVDAAPKSEAKPEASKTKVVKKVPPPPEPESESSDEDDELDAELKPEKFEPEFKAADGYDECDIDDTTYYFSEKTNLVFTLDYVYAGMVDGEGEFVPK
jgi:hypothetical protein